MEAPTKDQLLEDDGVKSVYRLDDTSWRHGSHVTEVFKRESDGTFWQVCYDLSTDCETHGLREGDFDLTQVYPHEVTAIEYRETPA